MKIKVVEKSTRVKGGYRERFVLSEKEFVLGIFYPKGVTKQTYIFVVSQHDFWRTAEVMIHELLHSLAFLLGSNFLDDLFEKLL